MKRIQGIFSLALLAFVFFLPTGAHAGLCLKPAEIGTWVNSDPNTRGITKVVYEMECISTPIRECSGNICSIVNSVTPKYYVKVWGKCSPSDCYWGREEANYTSANWMRSFYDQGFAKRWVWGQIWSGSNNWLRVIIDTDFVSSTREDYRFDGWFIRQ